MGGYKEWEAYRAAKATPKEVPAKREQAAKKVPQKREKFTNRERAELEALPAKISELEKEQEKLSKLLQDPDYIRANLDKLEAIKTRLEEIEKLDGELFERWSFLEDRRARLDGQA